MSAKAKITLARRMLEQVCTERHNEQGILDHAVQEPQKAQGKTGIAPNSCSTFTTIRASCASNCVLQLASYQ